MQEADWASTSQSQNPDPKGSAVPGGLYRCHCRHCHATTDAYRWFVPFVRPIAGADVTAISGLESCAKRLSKSVSLDRIWWQREYRNFRYNGMHTSDGSTSASVTTVPLYLCISDGTTCTSVAVVPLASRSVEMRRKEIRWRLRKVESEKVMRGRHRQRRRHMQSMQV